MILFAVKLLEHNCIPVNEDMKMGISAFSRRVFGLFWSEKNALKSNKNQSNFIFSDPRLIKLD